MTGGTMSYRVEIHGPVGSGKTVFLSLLKHYVDTKRHDGRVRMKDFFSDVAGAQARRLAERRFTKPTDPAQEPLEHGELVFRDRDPGGKVDDGPEFKGVQPI
jgi:hypothetical protein